MWIASERPAVALTSPGDRSLLTGLAAEGSRVFVGDANLGTGTGPFLGHTRVVSDDLASIGAAHLVATQTPIAGTAAPVAGFGHRAEIGWDEASGCTFVALAEDGSAANAPVSIDASNWCFGSLATPEGFLVFMRPPWINPPPNPRLSLVKLDPTGHVVHRTADFAPVDFRGAALFEDGTFLLAQSDGGAQETLVLQHFSASGDALAAPVTLGTVGSENAHLQIGFGALPSSAIIVRWRLDPSGGGTTVFIDAVDEDGAGIGSTRLTTIEGVDFLAVHAVRGGALVAWTQGTDEGVAVNGTLIKADDGILVQPIFADGEAEGEPITLPLPAGSSTFSKRAGTDFVGEVALVDTPRGALLAFDEKEQVFVTPLLCHR